MRSSNYKNLARAFAGFTVVVCTCFYSLGFVTGKLVYAKEVSKIPTVESIPLSVEEKVKVVEPPEIEFVEAFEVHDEYSDNEFIVDVTPDEAELMARVVMSEASILPRIGKVAVACVLVNRLASGNFGATMTDVIYAPNQFSTADNGAVTDECRDAVMEALTSSTIFPEDMFYFRAESPHPFGCQYAKIGNTYFNTLADYETIVNEGVSE